MGVLGNTNSTVHKNESFNILRHRYLGIIEFIYVDIIILCKYKILNTQSMCKDNKIIEHSERFINTEK